MRIHKGKKTLSIALSILFLFCTVLSGSFIGVKDSSNVVSAASARQVENLDRGLVAIKTSSGVYLSWRYLGTDSSSIGFYIYRNGSKANSSLITNSTNYLDASGSTSSTYYVQAVVNGSVTDTSKTVSVQSTNYFDIPLNKPSGGTTPDGTAYTYSPNDASVADLDGDGEYEIILKWDPSNSKDNSQDGYTGNVIIDAYKLNGTRLWRIDLGINIRAGAHYTQFMVYDFDGDGCAEMICKTADGTVDGTGSVIGSSSKDNRNSSGRILSGSEYLTLFDGKTGANLNTINYEPGRGTVSDWGDSYGNRVDRFLAAVAYLDGKTPSVVMCRGYYTRAVLVAYNVVNNKLVKKWTFDSNSSGNSAYAGQGNHNLAVADVDQDGYDEIVYGACTIDHDGTGLYSNSLGHGDAIHVGDFLPSRSGLEIWSCFETSPYGAALRDAKNGNIIFNYTASSDTGRALAGNFISGNNSAEFVSSASSNVYDGSGSTVAQWSDITKWNPNFAVYWDADLEQEVLDRTMVDSYDNGRILTASGVTYINGSKSNASLVADILGDWREEIIWPTSDGTALRVYQTTDVTSSRVYTLMHDTQYRCQIASQNVAYNQPAHTSFFLGTGYSLPSQPNVYAAGTTTSTSSTTVSNGWYYIKNPNSQKYLQVTDNTLASGQNVEIGTGSGVDGQKWYVENASDGSFTLKNGLGYMLDVVNASADDGANINIWPYNGCNAQYYKLASTSTSGVYGILTKASNYASGLDIYNFGTTDGSNVCQWTYYGNTCQLWKFESTTAPSGSSSSSPSPSSGTTSTSYDWNFSNSAFTALSTISSNTTVDSLTLVATSSKTMSMKSGSASYNGTNYTNYLALGGAGSTSYRALKFDANGSCTITVTGKSSGSSTRYLAVCDANENQLGTIECTSSLGTQSYNYTGSAGTIYLYSTGSGINLYEVKVN